MNILNGNEAFAALMAGKNIMCRAAGELIEFDDLDQFPATVFAMQNYEFCIKRETTVLADIQFTKPVMPHDLEVGQEIYIVMPTCILRTQYDHEHGDICLSVANGFAQLDAENAKLQLQAFGKSFGNMITEIEVKDGFNDKHKKTRASRKKVEEKTKQPVITDAVEASVEAEPTPKNRPAFTVEDVEEIEINPDAIVEKFTNQIAACTTVDAVLSLRPVFFANGHLEREQHQHLCKLTEDKLLELDPDTYTHQSEVEITAQENVTISEDSLVTGNEYKKLLNELLDAASKAHTPKQANALYRYTTSWTEEQRKPLVNAIHKRLNELNPVEKSESSLMVRIQESTNLIDLAKLEEEISKCDPLIQERLTKFANQRRTDLIDSVDLPWETGDEA